PVCQRAAVGRGAGADDAAPARDERRREPLAERAAGGLGRDGLRDKKKAAEGAEQDDAAPERTIAEVREELVRILLEEPFRQGAEAAVHEARLLSSEDWGFEFEDVDYDAVRMWHGVEDGNAPVAMIRYMAERLPHSVLHEFEGDTHYTMFKHLEGALAELVGQEGGRVSINLVRTPLEENSVRLGTEKEETTRTSPN
ncbi:hypothetical protein AK830_g10687, partial [Neonectria ditissima]